MTITVRDVWRGVLPEGTELIAGGSGLERRIEWATSLRTRPPAFDSVKGGELAFVPVRSIRLLDDRLDLAQVMASLGDKGGVAVAIVGDASADAIAVADRMMLPLLKLPAQTSIPDVQHSTVRFILDQRTLLHEKEHELRLELMELALAAAGVAAIVDRLAAICGCPALWQSEDGAVRHRAGEIAERDSELAAPLDEIRRWLAGMSIPAADPPVREVEAGVGMRLVAPIPLRDGIGGFISVFASASRRELARIGVVRAASACAIEVDRDRAVSAARDDIEGDIGDAILSGAYTSADAITERAQRLGVDVTTTNQVVVLAPDAAGARIEEIAANARKWCESQAPGSLATTHHGRICVVMTGVEEAQRDISPLAQRLLSEMAASAPKARLCGGIGRVVVGVGAIAESHDEAVQAALMGGRLFGPGRAVPFSDLGLHRLLFSMTQHPELRHFRDETLERFNGHDAKTRTELMSTLEAFFACHGSPTEIAHRLHLHRNTVLYRLRRIEEIGGISLNDPMVRLCLHLALRAGDVLQMAP